MTRSLALCALISLAGLETVAAQAQRGAGISGGTFSPGVDANYVREHWGPPDSVRLAAAVLWRGTPGWTSNRAPGVQPKLDSLQQAALRHHVLAGGTISPVADAWVEYDQQARSITILGRAYSLAPGDSTMVLMVDRVDHVGGEPSVSAINVVCGTTPDADLSPGLTEDVVQSIRQQTASWKACLRRDPRVAAFLAQDPSR